MGLSFFHLHQYFWNPFCVVRGSLLSSLTPLGHLQGWMLHFDMVCLLLGFFETEDQAVSWQEVVDFYLHWSDRVWTHF